jgi:hypothetical protein
MGSRSSPNRLTVSPKPSPPDRPGRHQNLAIAPLGPALQLFRIESERIKLPAPFSRRVAESLDADAAGQATFYGCFHKIGREEGKRDGHIDLANAALLASAKQAENWSACGAAIILD